MKENNNFEPFDITEESVEEIKSFLSTYKWINQTKLFSFKNNIIFIYLNLSLSQ